MNGAKEGWKKCLLALPVATILNSNCLRRMELGDFQGSFTEVYLNSITGAIRTTDTNERILVMYFFNIAYLMILSIVFGMDLHKEVYGTGIYVMTRIKSRSKWFLGRIGILLRNCIISAILYCSCDLLLHWYHTGAFLDKKLALAYFITVVFVAYNVFLLALIINAVSIIKRSSVGVFAGTATIVLMLMFVLFYENIPLFSKTWKFIYLAPVGMTNLFYETDVKIVAGVFVYYFAIIGLLVVGLVKYVKHMDIKLLESDL
jgi:hypothetical protein